MEQRGAIQAADVDHWIDTAPPGSFAKYAWGGDLPRHAPGVIAAKRASEAGLVTFTCAKLSDGRREYRMHRTAKHRADKAEQVRRGFAQPAIAEGIILQELRIAAANSRPCPTNAELARRAGLPDEYAASYIVGKLKAARKIHVQHAGPGRRRVVTIASSGARTRMEVAHAAK